METRLCKSYVIGELLKSLLIRTYLISVNVYAGIKHIH